MGLYFVELRWLNLRLLNCNYKRYLKNIRPESKKYTGQIFILKNYHHFDDESWQLEYSTEKRESKVFHPNKKCQEGIWYKCVNFRHKNMF